MSTKPITSNGGGEEEFHDPEWWEYWKNYVQVTRNGKPIEGECRFTFFNVSNIDLVRHTFDAHVLIEARVSLDQLPNKQRTSNGKGYKVKDETISYWNPKLLCMNISTLTHSTSWIRTRDDYQTKSGKGFIVYCLELKGTFHSEMDAFRYPMDTNKLRIVVSSDWDQKLFSFMPGRRGHRFLSEKCKSVSMSYYLLDFVDVVQEESTGSSNGKDGTKKKYDEVIGEVIIFRKWFIPLFIFAARPFILTTLGFSIFFLSDSLQAVTARISLSVGLLVSASFGYIFNPNVITFVDIYVVFSYLILALTNLANLNIAYVIQTETTNITAITDLDNLWFYVLGAIWIIISSLFLLYVLLTIFSRKNLEIRLKKKVVLVETPATERAREDFVSRSSSNLLVNMETSAPNPPN